MNMQKIGLSQIKIIEATVQSNNDYISLSQGALKVGGVPIEIKHHLQKVLQTDKTDYYESAWGIAPLREKIATNLSKKHGASITSEHILVTHGCMGAISTLLFTLLDRGDEVLLPEPTYPAYKHAIGMAAGVPVFVSSMTDDGVWSLDFEKLEQTRTAKTKMVMFSNPCNPTGAVVQKESLERLIKWCKKHGIYLVVDEAYDDYIFGGPFDSVAPYVVKSELVIQVGSYSKSLSMSGWRVGHMVVPKSLSRAMGITQDAMLGCLNVIAQHAVLYALDHPKFAKKFHEVLKKNRQMAIDELQPLVDQKIFSFQKPQAGFYLFLKTQEADAFELCMSLLHEAKVGLIPGQAFGPSGRSFIRLCYARTEDVLKEGIERVRKFFL